MNIGEQRLGEGQDGSVPSISTPEDTRRWAEALGTLKEDLRGKVLRILEPLEMERFLDDITLNRILANCWSNDKPIPVVCDETLPYKDLVSLIKDTPDPKGTHDDPQDYKKRFRAVGLWVTKWGHHGGKDTNILEEINKTGFLGM